MITTRITTAVRILAVHAALELLNIVSTSVWFDHDRAFAPRGHPLETMFKAYPTALRCMRRLPRLDHSL
jgi:hypothetical protein